MKLLRLFALGAAELPPDRCDAACRDRARRERLYDAAAEKAIRT